MAVGLLYVGMRQALPDKLVQGSCDMSQSGLPSIQNTTRPDAGLGMAFRAVNDILGGSRPLLVDLTSRMAELSGALLSVLKPTWPYVYVIVPVIRQAIKNRVISFILNGLLVNG